MYKPREQIKNRLAELRRERGLTQADVSRIFGFHVTLISKQETGDRYLSRAQAVKYATLYRCTLLELFLDPNDVPDAE
jgi:transcriptional regulator with XRE-family HTH domain